MASPSLGLKFKGKVRDSHSSDSDPMDQIPDYLGGRDEVQEVKFPLVQMKLPSTLSVS